MECARAEKRWVGAHACEAAAFAFAFAEGYRERASSLTDRNVRGVGLGLRAIRPVGFVANKSPVRIGLGFGLGLGVSVRVMGLGLGTLHLHIDGANPRATVFGAKIERFKVRVS